MMLETAVEDVGFMEVKDSAYQSSGCREFRSELGVTLIYSTASMKWHAWIGEPYGIPRWKDEPSEAVKEASIFHPADSEEINRKAAIQKRVAEILLKKEEYEHWAAVDDASRW